MMGGQLSAFVARWEALGAPPPLLKIISGYSLPFQTTPPFRNLLSHIPQPLITPSSPEMSEEVAKLLHSGTIAPTMSITGFISPMFLRRKQDGTKRPIFDLRHLNTFLSLRKFRLINHFKIPQFLQENDYMITFDLESAYCHVPIAQRHQRFLCFHYQRTTFAWQALPFGLASAPQTFASLSNWVAAILRTRGVRVIVYLDDFMVAHQNSHTLTQQARMVKQLFTYLGWTVNEKKSRLNPQQQRRFLGLRWDTTTQCVSLPFETQQNLATCLQKLQQRPVWSLRSNQQLLGRLGFAAVTVPLGKLMLRPLQLASRGLRRDRPFHRVPIPRSAQEAIEWWRNHINGNNRYSHPTKRVFLSTDASDWGMGVTLGPLRLSFQWRPKQRHWSINRRELYAVRWAISTAPEIVRDSSVLLLTDSRTVAAYIRHQGGLRSSPMLQETALLLKQAQELNIHLQPHFIPGKYNTLADRLSRDAPPPEWHLLPSITHKVFQRWGTPSIDLFASAKSAVVPAYASIDQNDAKAMFVDAFSRTWNFQLAWIFPPPPLIPQVLHHLNSATGTYLLVSPRWTKTYWRPDIKTRAIDAPMRVTDLPSHLLDLSTNSVPPNVDEMELEIWKLRGGRPT
uniref:Reverse transcriptase domain-containing protein n=1 Tax=Lygus hesperus TaxID=30085 RepID=A0A0K8TC30_LYGHE